MTILQLWLLIIFIIACLFVVWVNQHKMHETLQTNARYGTALQKLLKELLDLPDEAKNTEDFHRYLGIIQEALHPKRSWLGKDTE